MVIRGASASYFQGFWPLRWEVPNAGIVTTTGKPAINDDLNVGPGCEALPRSDGSPGAITVAQRTSSSRLASRGSAVDVGQHGKPFLHQLFPAAFQGAEWGQEVEIFRVGNGLYQLGRSCVSCLPPSSVGPFLPTQAKLPKCSSLSACLPGSVG